MRKKLLLLFCEIILLFLLTNNTFTWNSGEPYEYDITCNQNELIVYLNGTPIIYSLEEDTLKLKLEICEGTLVLPCGSNIKDTWSVSGPSDLRIIEEKLFLTNIKNSAGQVTPIYMQKIHFKGKMGNNSKINFTNYIKNTSKMVHICISL